MSADNSFSLTKVFQKTVKTVFFLALGAILTEPIIFSLVHSNGGGMLTMAALDPYFQSFFDGFGITDALTWFGESLGGVEQIAQNTGMESMFAANGQEIMTL